MGKEKKETGETSTNCGTKLYHYDLVKIKPNEKKNVTEMTLINSRKQKTVVKVVVLIFIVQM